MRFVYHIPNNIRELLISKDNKENIIKSANRLIFDLEKIKKKVALNKKFDDYLRETLEDDISDVIDNFQFTIEMCDGSIPEAEYDDYDFDGNHKDLFNSYLKEFWDMCDLYIDANSKFIFVDF